MRPPRRLASPLGLEIWNLGLGIWSLGLGPWNLRLGTWNLEFGAWDFEFGPCPLFSFSIPLFSFFHQHFNSSSHYFPSFVLHFHSLCHTVFLIRKNVWGLTRLFLSLCQHFHLLGCQFYYEAIFSYSVSNFFLSALCYFYWALKITDFNPFI